MHSQTILLTGKTQSLGWGNKILAGLIAAMLLTGVFFASLFIFAAFSVLALIVGTKLWWSFRSLKRSMQKPNINDATSYVHIQPKSPSGQIIEGEYHVKSQN